jgi:uncharacterized protein
VVRAADPLCKGAGPRLASPPAHLMVRGSPGATRLGGEDPWSEMARTGSADLPLHSGYVPRELEERMARLGRVMVEALVLEYGRDELLRRLSHPFWFQSLGCLMGMDWHSSGVTTAVLKALRRGLAPVAGELGVYVLGGKGLASRKTPEEISAIAEATGLPGERLIRASRLSAKVDSAALQDGFAIYIHGFVLTAEGRWAVVQQGMDVLTRRARRYHWLSEGLESFVVEPHAAIAGPPAGEVVNLTDRRALASQRAQLELVAAGPDRVLEAISSRPRLSLPEGHAVPASEISPSRLYGSLAAAARLAPSSFEELLLCPGLGARTALALALAAEVLHGAPYRFSDPARFSLAHGGKDRHPYPVSREVYDRTLSVLRRAVDAAKLGNSERLAALRGLDEESRRLERPVEGPFVERFLEEARRGERVIDAGREPRRLPKPRGAQLALPGLAEAAGARGERLPPRRRRR